MGGLIALEAARQLLAAGQEVALVAMFDTYLSPRIFRRTWMNSPCSTVSLPNSTSRSQN